MFQKNEQTKKENIKVKLLTQNARRPKRKYTEPAGIDLYATKEEKINAWSRKVIRTDCQIQPPPGTYGRIAGRSGLAASKGVLIGGGVIDRDFRGNLAVILFNMSPLPIIIAEGEGIAQLICEKIKQPHIEILDYWPDETERGDKGLGTNLI